MATEFAVGDRVRYHPIIGGPHDGEEYAIRNLHTMCGTEVAWLSGKSGCVDCDALSPIEEQDDD